MTLTALKRRVTLARRFPMNTCPSSRHVELMARALTEKAGYPMLAFEAESCAASMLATVLALYQARTAIAKLTKARRKGKAR